MLFDPRFFPFWTVSCILLTIFVAMCAGYAYHVNLGRAIDDPKKRDFHLGAVFLAVFGWPIWLLGYVGLVLLRATTFAVSLILLTFMLVFVRKPFLLIWLEKALTYVGNILLVVNTAMIYAVLGKKSKEPPS